jgi:beta-lactamase family protein/uncharacterized protein
MFSRRLLLLGVGFAMFVIVAGCGSSATPIGATTSSHPSSRTISTTPAFVARTAPNTPVGGQLTWFLGAVSSAPLSQPLIEAHFDSGFLAKVGSNKINSVLSGLQSSSGASLDGLLLVEPTALQAVATIGGQQWTISISVDSAGLIEGLLLTRSQAPPESWTQLDRDLAALSPQASFLAARVSSNGRCIPIHQLASSTTRPLASMFKLFVLGALAREISDGRVSWDQQLTVTPSLRSIGSVAGSLQYSPAGTKVTVQQTATNMISISDNTAADMLINLVGRDAVESQVRQWTGSPALDNPFLTTRELFLLHDVNFPRLANQYLGLKPTERTSFLTSSVDPLSLSQVQQSGNPRDINSIEWFASPSDICRAFAGLQQLSTRPGLASINSVLSANTGDIQPEKSTWPTVWFKGGSEPGVLTLGYLAKDSSGHTFVAVVMVENPASPLPPSATSDVLAIARGAFSLVK